MFDKFGFQKNTRLSSTILLVCMSMGLSASSNASNILNGDFSLGNIDFTSQYIYLAPGQVNTVEGQYAVGEDPSQYNGAWSGTPFQQTFLIANGSPVADTLVWSGGLSQGYQLQVGATYTFSLDITTLYFAPEASLELVANGVADPTQLITATSKLREITNQKISFVATSANETFGLIDVTDTTTGNDFAITNLDVQPVPEPASLLLFAPVAAFMFRKRRS